MKTLTQILCPHHEYKFSFDISQISRKFDWDGIQPFDLFIYLLLDTLKKEIKNK
jgi:hypothetical protein